ncbi:MAG: hypothetical protein KAS12_04850 [Candidatus Aenigmarchaeota archaeon]|nr:hypothetical protein [Candidatus Aenigmarchaeota archaeon]
MNKKTKYFLAACLALTILIIPLLTIHAQLGDAQGMLTETIADTGLTTTSLPQVIGNILKVVLSFLGLIALIIIVFGGFMWMTAGGAEEKVKKAKDLMINGVIGLVIIVLAYAIAGFIIESIITAAG